MKSGLIAILLPLSIAALPAAAAGQDVTRRSYAFMERQLTIEVHVESAGVLHIVRGLPGQLAVAARAGGGLGEFALAGHARDRLTLTAVGGANAEYVVTVPEHVQLHIALPGQHSERAPYAAVARYVWTAAGDAPAEAGADVHPALTGDGRTMRR